MKRTNACGEQLLKYKGKKLKFTTLGFTLIELLAVIVILAIITLIATPIILDVINDTKKSATELSVKNYIKAIELSISNAYMKDPTIKLDVICQIKGSNNGNQIKCGDKNINLEYEGQGLIGGTIELQKGAVTQIIAGKINKWYVSYENNELKLIDEYGTNKDCFEFDKSTGTITSYKCVLGNSKGYDVITDVIIPEKIDGVSVKIIGERAFSRAGLTSVIIPNTVEKINFAAFHINKITKLIIPEGVKVIETDAFSSNYIQILSLPSTLTSLAHNSFHKNKLKEENAYFYKRNSDGSIDYSMLIGYGGESKDIIIPSEKNGVKLTKIGTSAFDYYGLTSVEIPDTVTTIGTYAFRKCGLIDLKISNGVTSIGAGAFHGNKLTELIIPEGTKEISMEAFSSNYIEELTLPTTLTSIGYYSFRHNKLPEKDAYIYKRNSDGSIDYSEIIGYGGESKDIIIPSEKNGVKLKIISVNALRGISLTSVIIPKTVTSIRETAFYDNNLTTLEIPSSVTTIDRMAFGNNNALTEIIIKNTSDKVSLEESAFGNFDINQIKWEPVVE